MLDSWSAVNQFLILVYKSNESRASFRLNPSMLKELEADSNLLHAAAARAGFSRISWRWWNTGKVEVTSMERFSSPFRIVRTLKEVVSAVSFMREAKAAEFVLLPDSSLYASLMKDSQLRTALLLEGGLYHWGLQYHNDGNLSLRYTSCTYWNGAVRKADSESGALAAIEEMGNLGYDSFALVLDKKTFDHLTAPGSERLAAFRAAAYVECGVTIYSSAQILVFHRDGQSAFYPGYAILRSLKNGTENKLPDKLKKTLQEARRLVSGISGTPEEKVIAIHDLLCRHITYTIDKSTDDDDRCVGAILYGKANCDGYSDAFLLLCGLKGIPVMLVQGNARKVTHPSENPAHLWNLVYLNGKWRGVDVTWDDDDQHGTVLYNNFNIGEDRMKSALDYLSDFLPSNILKKTDLLDRPVPEFEASTENDFISALRKTAAMKKTRAELWLSDKLYTQYQSAKKPVWKWMDLAGVDGDISYSDQSHKIFASNITMLGSGILVAEANSSGDLIRILREANRKTVTEVRIYCSDVLFSEYTKEQKKIWNWIDSGGISSASIRYSPERHMLFCLNIRWK